MTQQTQIAAENQDFTATLTVDQTPEEAFAAIQDMRGWWSASVEGKTGEVGDVFTFQYKDVHRSTQKLVEMVPGKTLVWLVQDAHLTFTRNPAEWTGTRLRFDIARKGGKTEVRFTHVGLTAAHECYGACSKGWTFLVRESLRDLIATGKGQPVFTAKPEAAASAR